MNPSRARNRASDRPRLQRRSNDPLLLSPRPAPATLHRLDNLTPSVLGLALVIARGLHPTKSKAPGTYSACSKCATHPSPPKFDFAWGEKAKKGGKMAAVKYTEQISCPHVLTG